MSDCRRCIERGKTWDGDDPVCGFSDRGMFSEDNWNCATLDALRDPVLYDAAYNDDQRAAVVPVPGGDFIVLGWYKHRGRVEIAMYLSGTTLRVLTLDDAERTLDALADLPADWCA